VTTGLRQAVISIASDDSDEGQYIFEVEGTGTSGPIGTTEQNAASPLDVNDDGLISNLDALIVINTLLTNSSTSSGATPLAAAAAADPTASAAQYFEDVNGDGIVSPLDALLVLNYLETRSQTAASLSDAASPAAASLAAPDVNRSVLQGFAATDQAVSQLTNPASGAPPVLPTSSGAPILPVPPSASELLTPLTVAAVFSSADLPDADGIESEIDA
jgi:hypothetical protein